MNMKTTIQIVLFVYLCATSCVSYSKNGVYQGADLYEDCMAVKNTVNHTRPKLDSDYKFGAYAMAVATCSSVINAVYDMAIGHTNLIQNEALKTNNPDLTASTMFFSTHYFCIPEKLSNVDLIFSVIHYMESQQGIAKKYMLVSPAVDVILDSFHSSFPCE
jgi:hypothetical protein